VESDIRDNPAMSRFEMPLGDGALAVAYYKVEDGRLVLLHTEVPQELSGLGYGSRLAHGVFEALRRDGKRVNATALSCPPTRPDTPNTRTPRRLIADGRDAGAHSAFGRRYLTPIECMSKGNFQFRPLHPIFGSAGPAEHTRPPRQGLKLLRRAAARGQQRSPP